MIDILYRHGKTILIIPLWVLLYRLPPYCSYPPRLLRDTLNGKYIGKGK